MTPEAINQAMAELDVWKPTTDGGICWDINGKPLISYPQYAEDLNAVARVVQNLTHRQRCDYLGDLYGKHPGISSIDATASQRCEAILRACGKWVDQ